jgi:transcription antitermination factor NusG
MALHTRDSQPGGQVVSMGASKKTDGDRNWYAVYSIPQNEQSTARHLAVRDIESFVPTYETVRVWKNRQRMSVILPLFPSYLFVKIEPRERVKVIQCPGVLQVVGNGRGPLPLPDSEVEFLRSGLCRQQIEPYRDLVIGERVRIKSGILQGVEGTLVRRSSSMRFVLTLDLINQHAAINVDAEYLETASAC